MECYSKRLSSNIVKINNGGSFKRIDVERGCTLDKKICSETYVKCCRSNFCNSFLFRKGLTAVKEKKKSSPWKTYGLVLSLPALFVIISVVLLQLYTRNYSEQTISTTTTSNSLSILSNDPSPSNTCILLTEINLV